MIIDGNEKKNIESADRKSIETRAYKEVGVGLVVARQDIKKLGRRYSGFVCAKSQKRIK